MWGFGPLRRGLVQCAGVWYSVRVFGPGHGGLDL